MTLLKSTLAAALALAALCTQAAPVAAPDATVLEAVVVTPTARYSASEWQMRRAGLAYVQSEQRGVKAWLKTVWKHFRFARSQIEV